MPAAKTTKHLIIDLQTGLTYGLKLDDKGVCKGIQALTTTVTKPNGGETVNVFESDSPSDLPYGKTIYALELGDDDDDAKRTVFTVVFPTKEDDAKGIAPIIFKRDMPDLVKAGIAHPGDVKKAAGVEDEAELKKALKNIDDMIGLSKAKAEIKQNIALARFNRAKEKMGISTKPISRHMVFTGNPGTGKTTFAREVAKVYHALGFIDKATVHEVKREDLVAGYVGQTALKTKEQIEKAKGGVLFIDEAYALSRDTGSDSKDFGREAIDTLVAAMENMRDNLIVIVAGYTEPMKKFIDANEGLKSRFMTYIGFEDYSLDDLGRILDFMVSERGYALEADARAHAMKLLGEEKAKSGKDFGNGRTVRNLMEKAEKELALRMHEAELLGNDHTLTKDQLKTALTTITLQDMEKVTLSGLGGPKKRPTMGFPTGDDVKKLPSRNDNPAPKLKNQFRL